MHSAIEILGRPAYKPRPGDMGYQHRAPVDFEDLLADGPRNHEIPFTEIDVVADSEPDIEITGPTSTSLVGTTIFFDANSLFDDEFPIEEHGQRDIDIQWYPAPRLFYEFESATDDPGLNFFFDDEVPVEQPGISFPGINFDDERLPPPLAEMSETSSGIPEDIEFK